VATCQSVLDAARLDLHDSDTTKRWPDSDLLLFLNDFIQASFQQRPDVFVGNLLAAPAEVVASDPFPLPLAYRAPAVYFIVFRCMKRDDQSTFDGQWRLNHDLWVEGIKAS
jgi:hypothetical protein